MADKERIAEILNAYRDEIRAKSPQSLSVWQRNRTVMPAGVGSLFRLAGSVSNGGQEGKRRQDSGERG